MVTVPTFQRLVKAALVIYLVFRTCQGSTCSVRGGILQDTPVSALTDDGWRICYWVTYATATTSSLFDSCGITASTYLFLGATTSTNSHAKFTLGAFGPASTIQAATTGSTTKAVTIGGLTSYWYKTTNAIGFAPTSSVSLNPCDTSNPSDTKRLCWNSQGTGGYRAGAQVSLNASTVDHKIILAKECTSTHSGHVLFLSTTTHSTSISAINSIGMVYTTITPASWASISAAYIQQFDVVMFGDPGCLRHNTILPVPGSNANTWNPAIDGNIIILNADEAYHNKPESIRWGLRWAAGVPGTTGLYLSLSCYGTMTITALQYFGTFTSVNNEHDHIQVVSSGTALGPLTGADLSRWGNTAHGYFSSYPSNSFFVVAQQQNNPSRPVVLARRDTFEALNLSIPTSSPTSAPTTTCSVASLGKSMVSTFSHPHVNISVDISVATPTVSFNVRLPFLTDATYVLDFVPYSGQIDQPTNCENRDVINFAGRSFPDFWRLSYGVGASAVMYQSTRYWKVEWDRSTCKSIIYRSTFSWPQLDKCTDKNGSTNGTSISVKERLDANNNSQLVLAGRLTISAVRPFSQSSDTSFYHVHPVANRPFEMSIFKSTLGSVSSISMQNFQFSSLILGLVPDGTTNIVTILTTCDRLFKMTSPNLIASPSTMSGNAMTVSPKNQEQETTHCIEIGEGSCLQSFELTIQDKPEICPEYFNGTYTIEWSIECRINTTSCVNYLNNLQIGGSLVQSIALSHDLSYFEFFCGGAVSNTSVVSLASQVESAEIPKVTGDRTFVTASAEIPSELSSYVTGVRVLNAWVCTANSSVSALPPPSNGQLAGCLSIEYVTARRQIFSGGHSVALDAREDGLNKSSARYSFVLPAMSNASVYTIFVHTQLELRFAASPSSQRRMLLSAVNPQNTKKRFETPFYHSIVSMQVHQRKESVPNKTPKQERSSNDEKIPVWAVIGIVAVAVLILLVLGVGMVLYHVLKKQSMGSEEEAAEVLDSQVQTNDLELTA